ncbi:MAG: 3-hydroxyacyl-ACP dehydratase FabZ [Deltaproteobacteria bacterium]|nr:3-hydroxyacyl-ACP dehydratase FabZ [Deltaproteobacteria bacterium]
MSNDALGRLPHSYPFRFLDKVIEISRVRGVAIKNVTANEEFFQGHFKDDPIMPGALIIEALAQLAGLVMNHGDEKATGAYIAKVKDMKFKTKVSPGDTVTLIAEAQESFSNIAGFSVKAVVKDKTVAEGEIVMGANKDNSNVKVS